MSDESGTCWRNTGLPGTRGLWSCERDTGRTQLTAAIARAEAAEAQAAHFDAMAQGFAHALAETEAALAELRRAHYDAVARGDVLEVRTESLRSAHRVWLKAYDWVGADSFDGMDPEGRSLMEHAASNARLVLDGYPDHFESALADKDKRIAELEEERDEAVNWSTLVDRHGTDQFDTLAEEWLTLESITRTFNALCSTFAAYSDDALMSRFKANMAAIFQMAFVEGALCGVRAELARSEDSLSTLRQQTETMAGALTAARDQFLDYARQHTAKGTPEGIVKAATNTFMAKECHDALSSYRAGLKGE